MRKQTKSKIGAKIFTEISQLFPLNLTNDIKSQLDICWRIASVCAVKYSIVICRCRGGFSPEIAGPLISLNPKRPLRFFSPSPVWPDPSLANCDGVRDARWGLVYLQNLETRTKYFSRILGYNLDIHVTVFGLQRINLVPIIKQSRYTTFLSVSENFPNFFSKFLQNSWKKFLWQQNVHPIQKNGIGNLEKSLNSHHQNLKCFFHARLFDFDGVVKYLHL
jgi:hypothetical protein